MSEVKLNPFPFCGSDVLIENVGPRLFRPSRNHPYCVYCENCDLLFWYDEDYGGTFDTKEEAAETWNRRADNV
ncbi:MAG: Lar family restriction alleviation protein [Oscillospiraceae bacterium]